MLFCVLFGTAILQVYSIVLYACIITTDLIEILVVSAAAVAHSAQTAFNLQVSVCYPCHIQLLICFRVHFTLAGAVAMQHEWLKCPLGSGIAMFCVDIFTS